jgi:putative transposase
MESRVLYYHVWFKTRRRKWLLLGDIANAAKIAIAEAAQRHAVRVLECETMVDHVHLLVEAENATDLSRMMHVLKGASARYLLESIPDIRMDAGTNHFWQKRYGAKLVEPAAFANVRHYIRTQKERPAKYAR